MPEWGVKQDATPGVVGKTVGTTYVTPTRIGDYEVQCTELCGSGHGEMHFKNIHVLSQAAFDKWLTQAKALAEKVQGGGGEDSRPRRLQQRGLRWLPHVHAGQVERHDGPVAR